MLKSDLLDPRKEKGAHLTAHAGNPSNNLEFNSLFCFQNDYQILYEILKEKTGLLETSWKTVLVQLREATSQVWARRFLRLLFRIISCRKSRLKIISLIRKLFMEKKQAEIPLEGESIRRF